MFRVHRNYLLPTSKLIGSGIPLVYSVYAVFTVNTLKMEQKKELNKGGRPRKEETEKLKYRVAVKMATPDYFRLLTQAHKAGNRQVNIRYLLDIRQPTNITTPSFSVTIR